MAQAKAFAYRMGELVGGIALLLVFLAPFAHAAEQLEKPDLKFGFIKLTDCVPLIVAYEKGFFEDEGLYVTLEAQANWKTLLDRVIGSELDRSYPSRIMWALITRSSPIA
ncbi:MAG: ABC transporter substrate-binding protein [Burkholderiales bacterium]